MKLFSPDSKFMIAMAQLGDLTILNFLYLLTCLPVFTIGAATTALYTVTFRNTRDWGRGLIRSYFRAFRDNFKQGTVLGLILLAVGGCTLLDAFLFYRLNGPIRYLFILFGTLFVMLLFTASYAFPLLSQFSNSTKETLKNAFILGLGSGPRSILMGLMNIAPFVVLYANYFMFFKMAFLWVFWYFSTIAYFNALLLKKVFKPYRNDEEDTQ